MFERAKFYSIDDLGNNLELTRAEEILEAYDEGKDFEDINDIIELYNVKLFLDNHLALKKWTEEQIANYIKKTKTFGKVIVTFFRSHFAENSAVYLFKDLYDGYKQDFWDIFEKFGLKDLLTPNVLLAILSENQDEVENILHCNKIVKDFDKELSHFLLTYSKTAELLVHAFLVNDPDDGKRQLYIPTSLSDTQKCEIVSRYLDSGNAQLGIIRILMQAKDVDGLRLTPKIRLKAKQLEPKLAEIPKEAIVAGIQYGFSIEFNCKKGIKPLNYSLDGLVQKFVYSEQYLDSLSDTNLFNCFCTLFGYIGKNGLINLCYNQNENLFIEKFETKEIKGVYHVNDYFRLKNDIAVSQLMMFDNYLHKRGTCVESLIRNYYEVHFKNDYGYPSHALSLPKDDDIFVNKNRVIAPEMESVIKMYDLFVEEGEINQELYEYKMGLHISLAKSLLMSKHKYAIIKDGPNEIYIPLRFFFSDQTLLSYVEPYKEDHYYTLYSLLSSGNPVYYSNYEKHQKPSIDYLIKNIYLKVTDEGLLVFENPSKIHALKLLWDRREISYYNCEQDVRTEIDTMVQKGWLEFDDYLLSPSERHYLNFYLNNTEYTNGFQLRNKYSHGVSSCFTSEEEHRIAYYYFLMIFIILLLKIDEDIRMYLQLNKLYKLRK